MLWDTSTRWMPVSWGFECSSISMLFKHSYTALDESRNYFHLVQFLPLDAFSPLTFK